MCILNFIPIEQVSSSWGDWVSWAEFPLPQHLANILLSFYIFDYFDTSYKWHSAVVVLCNWLISHSLLSSMLSWWFRVEFSCQCRRCRFHPWVEKLPWRKKWPPTLVFLPWTEEPGRLLSMVLKRSWTQLSDWTTTTMSSIIICVVACSRISFFT